MKLSDRQQTHKYVKYIVSILGKMVIGVWMKKLSKKGDYDLQIDSKGWDHKLGRKASQRSVVLVRTWEMCEERLFWGERITSTREYLLILRTAKRPISLSTIARERLGTRMARSGTVLPATEKTLACSPSEMRNYLVILLWAELYPSKIHISKLLIPNVIVFGDSVFKEVTEINSGVLIQSNWCRYNQHLGHMRNNRVLRKEEKIMWGHREKVDICKPNLLTSWFWTSRPKNYEK